jgi:amidase
VSSTDPLGAFLPGPRVELEPTGKGPLDGLSFAAKDVFDIAGQRTGFGNPTWLDTHPPAERTAYAVARLLGAGARLIGKTISDELTYSLTGENVHYGTPRNPACPDRVPGGSSSGSASAVAGEACDLALGTDCAGSVRLPASYCGIVGMRPTHGRIALDGVCPFAPSFDTVGWFARDPDVLARAGLILLGGEDSLGEPERLLVARDAFELVGPDVAEVLAPAVERAAAVVDTHEDAVVSADGLTRWMECFRVIQGAEIWQSLGGWVEDAAPELGPGIRERVELASQITQEDTTAARRERTRIARILDRLLRPGTVLCVPTAPGIAPLRGAKGEEVEVVRRFQAISLLCIANHGAFPQISFPLATLDGCPVGLSIIGRRNSDHALLRLARRLFSSP